MKRSIPLKRTAFKRKAPPREAPAQERAPRALPTAAAVPARAVMAANLATTPPRPDAKPQTFRSEAWLRAVRSIPCVHCGAVQVQAAHRNEDKSMSSKTDDALAASLCPSEHARIDQGRDLSRDERRALMDRYIVLTLRELVRRGLVGVQR